MKVSLYFYLNEEKKNSRKNTIPVYLRVRLNGRKAEGLLYHADILEKEKLLWDERTMRLTDPKHKANKIINSIQKEFDEFIILNGRSINRYTSLSIRDYLLGRNKVETPLLLDYVDNYFINTVEKNTNLSKGTKKNYKKAIRHFASFLKTHKKDNLRLTDINSTIVNSFKDFLLSSSEDGQKKGMTEPTAAGNIMKFKTIFSRAVEDGLMDKNPFKGVKLKTRSPRKPRLTISQIKALQNLDLTKYPRLIPYRDLFLFSCYTGLAYEDAHNLTYSDLIPVGKSDIKIYLCREKTDVLTEVVLVAKAKELVEKYKKEPENQILGRVLPQRSNQKCNDNLKIISNLIEVPFELKTHIARHTFRQLLGEAGIADMAVIKRMMGQNRKGDIDEVYYSVTEAGLLAAKEKLEHYLDQFL